MQRSRLQCVGGFIIDAFPFDDVYPFKCFCKVLLVLSKPSSASQLANHSCPSFTNLLFGGGVHLSVAFNSFEEAVRAAAPIWFGTIWRISGYGAVEENSKALRTSILCFKCNVCGFLCQCTWLPWICTHALVVCAPLVGSGFCSVRFFSHW